MKGQLPAGRGFQQKYSLMQRLPGEEFSLGGALRRGKLSKIFRERKLSAAFQLGNQAAQAFTIPLVPFQTAAQGFILPKKRKIFLQSPSAPLFSKTDSDDVCEMKPQGGLFSRYYYSEFCKIIQY